jgi:hypothetical protein
MVTDQRPDEEEVRMDSQFLRQEGRLAEEGVATTVGYVLPDIDAMMAEVGATYPLLGYAAQADEQIDERDALDAVILAGLISA